VPRATLDELGAIAQKGAPELHDRYSERALERALDEYLPRRREPVAPFRLEVDRQPYLTLFHALLSSTPFESAHLSFPGVTGREPGWTYLRPLSDVTLSSDGAAEVSMPEGAPEFAREVSPVRAMARLLLRDHYVPRSALQDREATRGNPLPAPRTDLFTIDRFAQFVRRTGVVPFSVALLLYYSGQRVRYELDLLDSNLLPDPRFGRLRGVDSVPRTSRLSHAIDRYIARGELSLPNARALEVVFETRGLTPLDLAPVFGGVRELANSSLETLAAKRLVTFHRPTGQYRPNLEAFGIPGARSRPSVEPSAISANPLLKTSVAELIAAAEARAACPLCGDPMPPGPRGLLCPKCTDLVATGAG
jgi:hypothetical protein